MSSDTFLFKVHLYIRGLSAKSMYQIYLFNYLSLSVMFSDDSCLNLLNFDYISRVSELQPQNRIFGPFCQA